MDLNVIFTFIRDNGQNLGEGVEMMLLTIVIEQH